MFCKTCVLRNFVKFTGKHLCQNLFFVKVAGLFKKFTGKHLCQSLFFNKIVKACNLIKKETLAQVFSCSFCEISKNTFSTEHLQTTFLHISTCSMLTANKIIATVFSYSNSHYLHHK